jgi:hypothetical protein
METASIVYVKIVYNIVYEALKSPPSKGEGCGYRLRID